MLERPSIPDQSTLALVPQGVGSEAAEARAVETASRADDARRRADRSAVRASLPGRPQPSVLEPRQTDVSDPEQARETRDAIAEADARSARLEEQLARFEAQAAAESRALAEDFGRRRGARITTSRDAEATARAVARSTVDDPQRAVSTQPYLSAEAALRVLA